MKLSKAFSLIELMVVIAIIGILSAICLPSYKNYIIKAKIVEAITVLHQLETVGTTTVQQNGGIAPNAVKIGGVTITSGAVPIALSGPKYVNYVYYDGLHSNGTDTGQFYCVFVNNIDITNLSPPSGGSWGSNNAICMSVITTNNIMQKFCGRSPSGSSVPAMYLPSGCRCANVDPMSNTSC